MALAAPAAYRRRVPAALYNRDLLRLASAIPRLGRLERAEGRSERRSPVCGSRVSAEVALDGQGRVADFAQQVSACALGQASAALLGASIIGRSAADLESARDSLRAWLSGESETPGDWPGLDILAPARAHPARHASILLAFEAAAEAAALARAESARA